jgi:hypothetical protein
MGHRLLLPLLLLAANGAAQTRPSSGPALKIV